MKRFSVLALSFVLFALFVAPMFGQQYVVPVDVRANDLKITIVDAGEGATFAYKFIAAPGLIVPSGIVGGGGKTATDPAYEGYDALLTFQTVEVAIVKDLVAKVPDAAGLKRFWGCLVIESDGPLVVSTEKLGKVYWK